MTRAKSPLANPTRALAILVGAVLALVLARPARAWGPEGHRIIAHLAYERLTPTARAAVDALIAHSAEQDTPACPVASLEDAATWPDCIRPLHARFDYLAVMHYEWAPLCPPPAAAGAGPAIVFGKDGAARFDGKTFAAADTDALMIAVDSALPYCPDGHCVVVETRRAELILKDPKNPPTQRLQALEEITHFVGDLHQPLHAAENHDHGGNDVQVTVAGRATNLHHVWDVEVVEAAVGTSETAAEAALRPLIAENEQVWLDGDLDDWWAESHFAAFTEVYPKLDKPPACGQTAAAQAISQAYLDGAAPLVRRRLAQAAVRLARMLNAALS